MSDKKSTTEKERKAHGRILSLLNGFTAWLYWAFSHSLFGRCMKAYSKEEQAAEAGLGGLFLRWRGAWDRMFRKFSRNVSSSLGGSRILKWIFGLWHKMLECPLNVYGILFALYGCYSLTVYFVFFASGRINPVDLLPGILLLLVSLPLFFSGKSLAGALLGSRVAHWFLIDICGISEESFKIPPKTSGTRYLVVMVIAFFGGALTYLAHPLLLPGVVLLIAIVVLVFMQPEIGAVLLLFAAPVLPFFTHTTEWLIGLIAVTAIGFLGKVLRGRRVFRFGLLDGMILLFLFLTLFGGVFTSGGMDSFRSAWISVAMLVGYFLVFNLAHNKVWLERCFGAMLFSGTVVAVAGILRSILETFFPMWSQNPFLVEMYTRMETAFGTSGTLAVYIVILLPMAFSMFLRQERRGKRVLALIGFLLILVSAVLSGSQGVLIGAIVALLLMLLLYHHKMLTALLIGVLPVTAVGVFFFGGTPAGDVLGGFGDRFFRISQPNGSFALSKHSVWQGVWNMARDRMFSGIGVGESAFGAVYPIYAVSGVEAVRHCYSLYLQIFSELGLVGLLVFFAILILFAQKCLEFLGSVHDQKFSLAVLAGLAGIVGALVVGVVEYIWYQPSVCFLFWAVIGLVSSHVRVGEDEKERSFVPMDNRPTEAECTVSF